MPGKKKKVGKKGNKGGIGKDGRLPPPPDFSQNRQGALEALLTYRIRGKRDVIDVYSEEAEGFKDRNYQQKEKNHSINQEKVRNLDTLVREAKEFEQKLSQSETVGREDVEKAMLNKLEFMRRARAELVSLEATIDSTDRDLEDVHMELSKLRKYKNDTQHERKHFIVNMKETMKAWKHAEEVLEKRLTEDIKLAKSQVDRKLSVLSEVQKEKVSERLLHAMDESAKGEIMDNIWLKQQIALLQEQQLKLQDDVDSLEKQNLEAMSYIYTAQHGDLEAAQKLFSIPGNYSTSLTTISSDSDLVSKSSNKLISRQLDLGLLSIEGTTYHLKPTPQQIHLPPIVEHNSHSISRTEWPITGKMLKTFAT